MENEIKLNEVDVHKLNLQEGDTLMVTIKSDDISLESLTGLQKQFRKIFPDNKVFLFGVGSDGAVHLTVAKQPEISYCSDCNCGKKERAEGTKE